MISYDIFIIYLYSINLKYLINSNIIYKMNTTPGRGKVYLDIAIDDTPIGKIILLLYD